MPLEKRSKPRVENVSDPKLAHCPPTYDSGAQEERADGRYVRIIFSEEFTCHCTYGYTTNNTSMIALPVRGLYNTCKLSKE